MPNVLIRIADGAVLKNLPKSAKKKIEKDLAFVNPEYKSAMEAGRYIRADCTPLLEYYLRNPKRTTYWVPKGYIYYLTKWLKKYNIPYKIKDNSKSFKKRDWKFLGDDRDYQVEAEKRMLSYHVGVLEAMTGSGKTVMACRIIAKRGQPTLIIVHSKELLYQWKDAIKTFLNYDCGLLGDGHHDIKDITVGIINSVKLRVKKLDPFFGHIIIDEVHRVAALTWSDVLQEFHAKHYLGLTATAFRRDGLGSAIFACIGPRLYKVDKDMLQKTGAVLKPRVKKILSRFWIEDQYRIPYATIIKKLCESKPRNRLIAKKIKHDLKVYSQNILVVSDRVNHCEKTQNCLQEIGVESYLLVGKTKKDQRQEIIRIIKGGKKKVLISTISLVGEGFDVPNLSALFLTTPIKFSGRLIQVCGRILRPSKGAKPRIYDVRDDKIDMLKYSGYARDRIYKKQWGIAA